MKIIVKIMSFLLYSYLIFFLPIIFGWKPLVIVSGSMEPMYHVGGLLYYQKRSFNDFKVNDIVVFDNNEHTVSHRLVEIKNNGFVTKGDANNKNDTSIVYANQVLGIGTKWCIPFIGYYLDFIYNYKWVLIIFVLFIVINFIIEKFFYEDK